MLLPQDWCQPWAKCSECGWDGPQTDLTHFNMAFRSFPECPACGARWNTSRHETYKVSSITTYVVHKECGRRHPYGSPCPPPRIKEVT